MSSSFKAPFLLLDCLFSKAIAFQRLFSKAPVGSTLTLVLYYSLTTSRVVIRMCYEFTYKSQLARYVRLRPAFTYKSQLAQFDSHDSILIGLTRSPVSTIWLTRFNPDRINSVGHRIEVRKIHKFGRYNPWKMGACLMIFQSWSLSEMRGTVGSSYFFNNSKSFHSSLNEDKT